MIRKNTHPVDELELMAYLDGELSRERAGAAAAHLEACAECKAVAEELRGVSRESAGWQVEPADMRITTRLSAALEKHEFAQQRKTRRDGRTGLAILRRRRVWPWALAGTALAILLVGVGLTFRGAYEPQDDSALWPNRQVSLPSKILTYITPAPAPTPGGGSAAEAFVAPSGSARARNKYAASNNLERRDETDTNREPHQGLPLPSGPMIVRTAEIDLTTTDFDQSRSRVGEILKRHNGYLGDLNVTGASGSARSLTATLRVPSDQLDATLAEIKTLGRVDLESQKGEEVSQQYVDLQARLQNSRNSEKRLTELLQRAGKLSDVLAVEEQIESVREDIERMEAERKNLAKQVDFSTLSMKVTEDYKERVQVVPDSTSSRFRNAAVDGYKTMVSGLINLLLFLVSWGPSLLLWGAVLFFPVRWLWRRRLRSLF